MTNSFAVLLLGLSLASASALFAQRVAFDAASIKPAVDPGRQPMFCLTPCTPGERLTVDGARVDIRFMSLYRLIITAYRIKPYQLSGPDWMKEAPRFDIMAKIPDGVSRERVPEMLQTLLAERFKLSIRRENKEQPVYALVVGKNGSKLKEATPDADSPLSNTPGGRGLYTPQGEARIDPNGDVATAGGPFGPLRGNKLLKVSMPALAELLSGQHLDRPVIDMTGLKGYYQLAWEGPPPPEPGARGFIPFDLGEAIVTALNKAGLKLEPRKAPVEMLIVEHVEKTPSGN